MVAKGANESGAHFAAIHTNTKKRSWSSSCVFLHEKNEMSLTNENFIKDKSKSRG